MVSPVIPNSSNSAVVSTNNSLTNGFNNGQNAYSAPINHSISATNAYSPSIRNPIANTESRGLPTSQLIESTNSSVLAHNSQNISSSLFFKSLKQFYIFIKPLNFFIKKQTNIIHLILVTKIGQDI